MILNLKECLIFHYQLVLTEPEKGGRGENWREWLLPIREVLWHWISRTAKIHVIPLHVSPIKHQYLFQLYIARYSQYTSLSESHLSNSKRTTKESGVFLRVMELYPILILLLGNWLYPFIKTYCTLKSMHFTICKYLTFFQIEEKAREIQQALSLYLSKTML